MESAHVTHSPILVGLNAGPLSDWHAEIDKLADLKITELALLLRDLPLDSRRALYRALEAKPPRTIPYVQLAADTEEWELRYLMTKYLTEAFSLPALESSYVFAASLSAPLPQLLIENPEKAAANPLFNDASLARTNISGVCLDTAMLERNRLGDKKSYEAVIAALDHCSVGVSIVRPVNDGLLARFSKQSSHLESLKQLRYVKHFPPSYFSHLMVIAAENLLEEQLEIQTYLKSVFAKIV